MYLVKKLLSPRKHSFNAFCNALLNDNIVEMKNYINNYLLKAFFSFDSINNANPECFYHGLVLGLVSELRPDFIISSNEENNEGSYYIIIKPVNAEIYPNSYIFEFNVKNEKEKDLIETAQNALMLISLNGYSKMLKNDGFPPENIKEYGLAFDDQQCEILLQTSKHPRYPGLVAPDFESISNYTFHENEKVFIIDPNKFDIWEGVIDIVKYEKYQIHYPDYPEDDETVEKERILPHTYINKTIFRRQENQRRVNAELKEKNAEKKVKIDGQKRRKKNKKNIVRNVIKIFFIG